MKNNPDSFFEEPLVPKVEARELALEVICRLLLWLADAPTLEDRGLRVTVALFCVRPDLINGATLEEVGELAGRTRQAVHKLVESFRSATGFES